MVVGRKFSQGHFFHDFKVIEVSLNGTTYVHYDSLIAHKKRNSTMCNMLTFMRPSMRKSCLYGERVKIRFVCFSVEYLFQKVLKMCTINSNTLLETTNE